MLLVKIIITNYEWCEVCHFLGIDSSEKVERLLGGFCEDFTSEHDGAALSWQTARAGKKISS